MEPSFFILGIGRSLMNSGSNVTTSLLLDYWACWVFEIWENTKRNVRMVQDQSCGDLLYWNTSLCIFMWTTYSFSNRFLVGAKRDDNTLYCRDILEYSSKSSDTLDCCLIWIEIHTIQIPHLYIFVVNNSTHSLTSHIVQLPILKLSFTSIYCIQQFTVHLILPIATFPTISSVCKIQHVNLSTSFSVLLFLFNALSHSIYTSY